VRSSSGNVYASGETISAAGQQWEIIEFVEAKDKRCYKLFLSPYL
jgi:zinc finger CCCH domain-containing protein 13